MVTSQNFWRASTPRPASIGLTAGIVGLVLACPLPAVAQTNYYSATVTAQAPVGYWRLDETTGTTAVATVGGSGLDGTYINFGGANPGLDQQGPRPAEFPGFLSDNVAKQFNGDSSTSFSTTAYTRVEVADQAALDITGALTISAWINPTSYGSTGRGIVAKYRLSVGDTSDGQRAYGFNVDVTGKLQFVLSTNGSFDSNLLVLGSTTVSTNAWQHVTAVYEPGSAMRVYLNGVLDGQKTTGVPASIASTAAPLWIGQQFGFAGNTSFIGRIDEPAVFNAALSAQAIRTQYTAGVFSGTSTWKTAGDGTWGSGYAATWTSGTVNGAEVNAAPGTFAGVTDADTAIFGSAVASGTATISLDGAAPSLRRLEFTTADASYVIATGTGGSLTLAAAAATKPVIDVVTGGSHTIVTAINGTSGLEKTGLGTLVLSGSSSYSGGTDITAGTLTVNGAIGGAVNVANAAILSGSGTLNGPVTVAAGGILAPGNSPGTLTMTSGLLLDTASFLNFELNAFDNAIGGGINDLLDVTGDFTLAGILNVAGSGDFSSVPDNTKWRLFNYSGGTFTDGGITLGSMPSLGSTGRYFEIDTATAGEVNLVIVPEPGGIALAGIGITAAACSCRRRRGTRDAAGFRNS